MIVWEFKVSKSSSSSSTSKSTSGISSMSFSIVDILYLLSSSSFSCKLLKKKLSCLKLFPSIVQSYSAASSWTTQEQNRVLILSATSLDHSNKTYPSTMSLNYVGQMPSLYRLSLNFSNFVFIKSMMYCQLCESFFLFQLFLHFAKSILFLNANDSISRGTLNTHSFLSYAIARLLRL